VKETVLDVTAPFASVLQALSSNGSIISDKEEIHRIISSRSVFDLSQLNSAVRLILKAVVHDILNSSTTSILESSTTSTSNSLIETACVSVNKERPAFRNKIGWTDRHDEVIEEWVAAKSSIKLSGEKGFKRLKEENLELYKNFDWKTLYVSRDRPRMFLLCYYCHLTLLQERSKALKRPKRGKTEAKGETLLSESDSESNRLRKERSCKIDEVERVPEAAKKENVDRHEDTLVDNPTEKAAEESEKAAADSKKASKKEAKATKAAKKAEKASRKEAKATKALKKAEKKEAKATKAAKKAEKREAKEERSDKKRKRGKEE
jgi:chemotaxis protein histidine kinase CheA